MDKVALGVVAFLLTFVLLIVMGLVFFVEDSEDKCQDTSSGSTNKKIADSIPATDGFVLPEKDALDHVTSEWRSPDRPDHQGMDISQGAGTPIYAFADGVVVNSGPADGFGQWIVLEHNFDGEKYLTVYGHMYENGLHVKVGDTVSAGQHIADEGSNGQSTGSHLHFEIWKNDRTSGNDLNPRPWLEKVASGHAPAKVEEKQKKRSGHGSGVLIIGDSITVGAQTTLERKLPGVTIDAAVGRQYTEGVKILAKTTESYEVVVMALGTNGPFSQADVDETLKAAGEARVYLMTVGGAKVHSAEAVNKLVKDNSGKVGVIDWAAQVKQHPDYIGSDGVHPTETGSLAFANLVASSIDGTDTTNTSDERQKLAADPGRFSEENLQRESIRLGRVVLAKYPQITTIYGWRPVDQFPDHPSGQAIDVMIPDWDTDEGKQLGQDIADFVMANAEEYKVSYIIWRQESISVNGFRNMMEDRGTPTRNHFDHVHVTVFGSGYPSEDEEFLTPSGVDVPALHLTSSSDCPPEDGDGAGRDVGFDKTKIPPELHKWIRLGGKVCKELPAPLLAAVLKQESNFQKGAVSNVGAQGYAQFMPDTWAQEGREVDDNGEPIGPPGSGSPYEAKDAIMASARYLCGIAARQKPLIASGAIKGNPTQLMLAGYNAGEGAVQNYGGVPPYEQIQTYVADAVAFYDALVIENIEDKEEK